MVLPLGDDNSLRKTTPYVTFVLIAVNAIVWFIQLSAGDPFTNGYSTVPYEITHGVDLSGIFHLTAGGESFALHLYPSPHPIYLTLLSAMFMHGSWLHILGNMLYLWIFGDNIEDLLGHGRYLVFYLACGIAASLAQVFFAPNSYIPSLGASGAIAGVLGAYAIKFPRNRVRVLLVRVITAMPAIVVLGFWILLQVFSQVASPAGEASGVAYMAHIGGFTTGVILVLLLGLAKARN
ncbi:MAG: rhomboid family intramembrane serine protease [Gemmatimonadota bacterium]